MCRLRSSTLPGLDIWQFCGNWENLPRRISAVKRCFWFWWFSCSLLFDLRGATCLIYGADGERAPRNQRGWRVLTCGRLRFPSLLVCLHSVVEDGEEQSMSSYSKVLSWRHDRERGRGRCVHLLKLLLEILDHGPESKWDCSAQRQAKGQEEGHDGPRCLCLMRRNLPIQKQQRNKIHQNGEIHH